MTELEKNEMIVLDNLKIGKMPKKASVDSDWTLAVVLVKRADGTKSYAIAKKSQGTIRVTKDFGGYSRIVSILETYPLKESKK